MIRKLSIFCMILVIGSLVSVTLAEDAKPDADTLATNVPESTQYTLVYDMDLNKLGKTIKYAVDNTEKISKFDRIAYYLELTDKEGLTKWVYVSMDAFTDDAKKIGIPAFGSEIDFQQPVKNMNVLTSEKSLTAGNGLDGNIEFWPNNYGPANAKKIDGADDKTYDFGDSKGMPQDGHGCMQVHLTKEKQTVFAINCWKAGPRVELGIGSRAEGNPDWTFAKNGADFPSKRLRILVLPAK
jgi:sialate O-acetylesterase